MPFQLTISKSFLKRKLVTAVFVTVSVACFATLGDGGGSKKTTSSDHNTSLLSMKPVHNYKTFSLKSGYNYRGNDVLGLNKVEDKYVTFNTLVTYQKGNSTYVLPLKKKVLSDKIKLGNFSQRY
jgi:hypothetical protein